MLRKSWLFSFAAGVAFAGATVFAPLAQADLVSVAYNNLTGKYDAGTSKFTALAQSGVLAQATDYTVSRLIPTTGSVNIAFNLPHGVADFNIDMTLTSVTTTSASGSGTFMFQDINGDKFTADIANGTWSNAGSFAFFGGTLSNVFAVASGNGTFEGTTGSGFSMTFPDPQPYTGAIVTLVLQKWFTDAGGVKTDFDKQTTNGSAQITVIPEPAAMVLGLIGMAPLVWRRRMA